MGKERWCRRDAESWCSNSGRCRLEKACESDGGVNLRDAPMPKEPRAWGLLRDNASYKFKSKNSLYT